MVVYQNREGRTIVESDMKKILLWAVGEDFSMGEKALSVLEKLYGSVNMAGVFGYDESNMAKCPWGGDGNLLKLSEEEVRASGADYVLVTGGTEWPFHFKYADVVKKAGSLGIAEERILLDRVVTAPGFNIEKYQRLRQSRMSIFAMNCFGGMLMSFLGLPFRSPLVQMFVESKGYLRMLGDLKGYMGRELRFKKSVYNDNDKLLYPVYMIGDAELHMNHYADFDEAETKWYERVARINWQDIFVTTFTDDENVIQEFDKLPIRKKACFTSLRTDYESAFYIDTKISGLPLWDAVNHFGVGWREIYYYDLFDLLLEGKKTPLL